MSVLLSNAALLGLFIALLWLARHVKILIVPFSLHEELTEKDNTACALSLCGYFAAVIIIYIGAVIGPSQGLLWDLINVTGYTLLGLLLLPLAQYVNDKLILYTFNNHKEIIEDRSGYDSDSAWQEQHTQMAVEIRIPESGYYYLAFSSEASTAKPMGDITVNVTQKRGGSLLFYYSGLLSLMIAIGWIYLWYRIN